MSAEDLPLSLSGPSSWTVLQTLFTLDLLTAAWEWDVADTRRVTGYSQGQLKAFRNHEVQPPQELPQLVDRLMALHRELWMFYPQAWSWRQWWLKDWAERSAIGSRTPMNAICEDGLSAIDALIGHYRQARSGDFT